jgi:hypothetical protein
MARHIMTEPRALPMKLYTFLLSLLISASAWAGVNDKIMLPEARFTTGDNIAWKDPDFDDRGWKLLNTQAYYENQGFENYNGYSWYRIHVTIPATFKATSRWQERLRVFLSAIDDSDETYFNGIRIGKTGRMPQDPGGYASQYQALRDYHVDLRDDSVRWDRDNVIAMRVYDGGGGGGFHGETPYLKMAEKIEGVRLETTQATHRFLSSKRVRTVLSVANAYPVAQSGVLEYEVRDVAAGRSLQRHRQSLSIKAMGAAEVQITTAARAGIEVSYRYQDTQTDQQLSVKQVLPYLLTPPESPLPALRGATVIGARPARPLLYRIAATGRAPLHFTVKGLPEGLSLDALTGVISGSIAQRGTYKLQLQASNALGKTKRTLSIIVGDTLSLTPPMGWNSWTAYGADVTDAQIRKAATDLINTGLAAHGWNYVNIDDGWESEKRSADGEITGNARFPDMRALGDFLHAKGLKFGIYSSPGALTCERYPGSLGHERQDAETYARWGVDYLKYDLCSYTDTMSHEQTLAEHQKPYQLMGEILRELPRDINYSLCQYGKRDVWNWGASVGANSWRTTWDVEDNWESVLKNGFTQSAYSSFAGPGHWNDPDTLVLGKLGWGKALHNTRLTPDEQYSQVSLWSLLAAPLLIGNDLSSLDAFTLNLLTNDEVIGINQDPLGHAAERVFQEQNWQLWVKKLEGGRLAVGVFNLGAQYQSFKLLPAMLGKTGALQVRDSWRQKELGTIAGAITISVPAHGVALYIVR